MFARDVRVRVETGSEAVRSYLRRLPPEMCGSSFQHPTWIDCWSAVDRRTSLRTVAAVVECAETGRPLLVLPLVRDTLGAAHYWTPLDRGVTDYNASLLAPDFRPSPAEMGALWKRIVAALSRDADFLVIDKVPAEICGRHEPLTDLADLRRSAVIRHPLKLDADFATLRETRFCQTMVRSLTRKRRKLARKGRFEFRVASGMDAAPVLDRLMVWRDERYGSQPHTTDLYRRLIRADGPARLLWLSLDGEPISACFGIAEPHAFRLLAMGHDDRFKNWSPGLLAVEDAIAWAIGQGFQEFDFTIGAEPYKLDFGATPEPLWMIAESFGPHGSAMLRLLLTRNSIASRLRRYLETGRPRRRGTEMSVVAGIVA